MHGFFGVKSGKNWFSGVSRLLSEANGDTAVDMMVNEGSEDGEHGELILLYGMLIVAEGKGFAAGMAFLMSGHNPASLKPDTKLCGFLKKLHQTAT